MRAEVTAGDRTPTDGERPLHIETGLQMGHWEYDTYIDVNIKVAVVTIVECWGGFAVLVTVLNKTFELVIHP